MKQIVLFVDDDLKLLESFKRLFRREPYEVITASSAIEALSIVNALRIDVVVSDQEMPLMSGTEFLSLIKKSSPGTKRVMLSGKSTFQTALEAINECSIKAFLTKPVEQFELAITLREALAERRSEATYAAKQAAERHAIALAVLEDYTPGITQVERTEDGAIILDEEG